MRDGTAVVLPNDLLIGLDVGPTRIEAAAFAPESVVMIGVPV